jgi:hypothetical protein
LKESALITIAWECRYLKGEVCAGAMNPYFPKIPFFRLPMENDEGKKGILDILPRGILHRK